jgi:hypothetical protein
VRRREGAAVEFIPLVTTSERTQLVETARVRQEPNPARLLGRVPPGQRASA